MDLTVPGNCPPDVQSKLLQLIEEYQEGYLTDKGYIRKREQLLSLITLARTETNKSSSNSRSDQVSTEYHFGVEDAFMNNSAVNTANPSQSQIYSYNESFSEDMPQFDMYDEADDQRYNYRDNYYESLRNEEDNEFKELQKPLEPRFVDDFGNDQNFTNLLTMLRHRGSIYQKETAIYILDSKGKESAAITWEKLYLRAEKIAQQIIHKAALYPGDRVCLIYQNIEVIDFIVALYGCFLSGTVAVPMNSSLPVKDIAKIMTDTQSHLCLMSDTVFKHFEKRNANKMQPSLWPKGIDVWKTTDMGMYQPPSKKSDPPALKVSDLAYIEYSRSSIGELRGIVISHRTIMHQMKSLSSILKSMPDFDAKSFERSDIKVSRAKHSMLSTLDARESIGLILTSLFTVYTGNPLYWTPQKTTEVAGSYAHIISKYKISILLSDYLSLKHVAYNYQSFPQMTRTFNKRIKPDLSSVKWCLINATTVDCEFNDMLTNRWFRPLGNNNAHVVISPILSLTEHGGAIISMRDWKGNEEHLGCVLNAPNIDLQNEDNEDDDSDPVDRLAEVLLDKASLMTNTVKIVSDLPPSSSMGLDNDESSKYVRVGAFGYPLPDATLAIVNPDTRVLSAVMEVGEIWVDSHCISGGFWGLPEDTQHIFQAECSDYEGVLNLKFVRTGLLGFTYNGKVYVVGPYEDRISQRVTWFDQHQYIKQLESGNSTDDELKDSQIPKILSNRHEHRYHYSSHLVRTLVRNIPEVSDCSFFNIRINKESLPVAIIESPAASPKTTDSTVALGGKQTFDDIASNCFEILEKVHNVRLYAVLITGVNVLPRTPRSGRMEIANLLCKRKFNEGRLNSVYVKFNIANSVSIISHAEDTLGGIWSRYSSYVRSQALDYAELQLSGLDLREECVDERTNMKLNEFTNLIDLLKLRAQKQPEELAFATIEGTGIRESKQLSWKKFEQRVFAICSYFLQKDLESGSYVILNYALSEEYVIVLYACLLAGYVPIPIPPLDVTRIDEDTLSFIGIIAEYKVKAIFTQNECEQILKSKPVSQKLKYYATQKKVVIPKFRITTKHTKSVLGSNTMYTKMEKYRRAAKVRPSECVIWVNWSPDHYYSAVKLTHKNLLAMSKILKETCQLTSLKPLLACVRHVYGLGFLQACIVGVYIGTATYIVSPIDFALSPTTFYVTASRYGVQNMFITANMIEHSLAVGVSKKLDLSQMRNLMIGWDGRPNVELMKLFKTKYAFTNLSPNVLSNVYNSEYNPMMSLRSYLSFDPVELWLDPLALSQGYISLVNPNDSPSAIQVQDSGIVPVCTQIAIVNPETCEACRVGEYGEIWVCSEATVSGYSSGKEKVDSFNSARFNARISNWNQDLTYMRTGDFGFLHSVSRSFGTNDGTNPVELQLLFVLGKITDTFEVMGLHYFAIDIESTVEKIPGVNRACAFRCGDYTVLVIEPAFSKRLASLVPLITSSVLNRFGLVIDVVSFTKPDALPLSRLGEIQRVKILEGWLSGRMQFIDSFGIHNGESSLLKTLDTMTETAAKILTLAKNKEVPSAETAKSSYVPTMYTPTSDSVSIKDLRIINTNTQSAHASST